MIRPLLLLFTSLLSAALGAQAGRLERSSPPPGELDLPGGDAGRLADRLRVQAVPLRWTELTQSGERVLYLGDMPAYRETKRYLAAVVGDFAAAGFTHLGLEADGAAQPHLDGFCGGRDEGKTALAFARMAGPEVADSTLHLLRASCSAGLKLVALEPHGGSDGAMAKRLAAVLSRDPSARVLALLRRHRVSTDAEPAALRRLGFSSRSYSFLTSGVEEPGGAAYFGGARSYRVVDPLDRSYYLALDAAGLRHAPLLLPCPPKIGAHGCLALPRILDERLRAER
jgi:hypothetical protein